MSHDAKLLSGLLLKQGACADCGAALTADPDDIWARLPIEEDEGSVVRICEPCWRKAKEHSHA